MAITPQSAEASKARRDLWREEMINFGERIPWLNEPSLVPTDIIYYGEGEDRIYSGNPYFGISTWMTNYLAVWSGLVHEGLNFGAAFNKHGLSYEERREVKATIEDHARELYSPGIGAMAEICSVIPWLAVREGRALEDWAEIADRARRFGGELARHGTFSQGIIRRYLYAPHPLTGRVRLDPSLLRLDDDTGVTTVTPLESFFETTKQLAVDYPLEDHPGICVALQAPQAHLGGMTMFDAIWNAYTGALRSDVYPLEKISKPMVPAQKQPNPGIKLALRKVTEAAHGKPGDVKSAEPRTILDMLQAMGYEIEFRLG